MPRTTAAKTRNRLVKHLRYCPTKAGGDCLQCAAARLIESLPDSASVPVERPVLDDMLATAERAAKEMDEVIAHLDGEHDGTMRAALNSIAVTNDSGSLTAILARAACAPGQPDQMAAADEALADATERLARIAAVHGQLVTELSGPSGWLYRAPLRRVVWLLASAWHGSTPHDPQEPLTPGPA